MNRKSLLAAARRAALHAYAPYSHFRVGAAVVVQTSKGPRVVTGANIENGSFGLTLCAERSALAAACMLESSRGNCPEETIHQRPLVTQIAVACIDVPPDAPGWRRSPCGACRQWMAELAPDAVLYIDGIEKDLLLADLLPYAFRLEDHG
jgi:cytidine deaminase